MSRKFKFSLFLVPAVYLPSDCNEHVMANPYILASSFIVTKPAFLLNPTLNNAYSTMFMWDFFLTAQQPLVIFLNTYKLVHMNLTLREEYMWRKDVCTNIFN